MVFDPNVNIERGLKQLEQDWQIRGNTFLTKKIACSVNTTKLLKQLKKERKNF